MDTESTSDGIAVPIGRQPKRRFLRLRYILKSSFGKLLLYFLSLAVLFEGMALAQRWFVRRELYRTADLELASWAGKVMQEIAYQDRWDLRGFRNAVIEVPGWYVVAQDGLAIDLEDSIPGVFGKATPVGGSIYDSPQTVVSSAGETWRLLGKKVIGGVAIVGISSPENIKEADGDLLASLEKFGSTIKSANSVRSRDVAIAVDYAVLSSTGEITNAFGGVPLKTSLLISPGADHCATVKADGRSYLLYFEQILDKAGQTVGTVIVPKDMTLEEKALRIQNRFNDCLVLAALGLVIGLTLLVLVRELVKRPKALTIEEALRIGETKTIEFKGSFQWDIIANRQNAELRLAVLKSIAGFLNSDGGNLFIGVAEDRAGHLSMRGVGDDLRLTGGSKDKFQLTLRNIIKEKIGSEFAPFISERFEDAGDLSFLIVTVLPAPVPVFLRWKEKPNFYVREGPRTSDLDSESTWRYIKNKWR